ncbi:MAG: hypothetical protein OEV85_09300 [Candidatus Thorarchaeota archaeon]|nr:hypothetical protein [Candidatus Thorarchaeota archaeon]
MPEPSEIERVGSLFSSISDQSKPFLDKCSKTKFLAVSDYNRAADEYVKLARQTLSNKGLGLPNGNDCQGCLSNVKSALETYQLDTGLLSALEDLRSTYLESMLKPAFKRYLQSESYTKADIEHLYMNALKIDSLIELIQFMKRIERLH